MMLLCISPPRTMLPPNLKLVRIPRNLASRCKTLGRLHRVSGSLVLNLAIEHGLPIAEQKIVSLQPAKPAAKK